MLGLGKWYKKTTTKSFQNIYSTKVQMVCYIILTILKPSKIIIFVNFADIFVKKVS